MSTLATLLGGGGGGDNTASSSGISLAKDGYIITTSQDLIMPADLTIKVIAIGAGGSGGNYAVASSYSATGGGAGGCCIKTFDVSQNEVLSIVIGANSTVYAYGNQHGGAPQAPAVNGLDGGATTVTNGNESIVLTANGGSGGVCYSGTGEIAGGAGGTATGGDFNYTGGRGGTITDASLTLRSVTGGGAVNFFGSNDCNGGDITVDTTVYYNATGGGSPFSSGSSITTNVAGANQKYTGGGGFSAPANDSDVGGAPFVVNIGIPHASAFSTSFLTTTTPSSTLTVGSGVNGYTGLGSNATGGFFAGAGASIHSSYTRGIDGGPFSGGGGVCCYGNNYAIRGTGGLYGGGAGACGSNANSTGSTQYYAGNSGGGAGAVIILIEKVL